MHNIFKAGGYSYPDNKKGKGKVNRPKYDKEDSYSDKEGHAYPFDHMNLNVSNSELCSDSELNVG